MNNRASAAKLDAPDVASDSEKMIDGTSSEKPKDQKTSEKSVKVPVVSIKDEDADADPDEIVVELDSAEEKPVRASSKSRRRG